MTKHKAQERVVCTIFTWVCKVQRLQQIISKAQPSQPELLAAEAKPYSPSEHHHIIATSINSSCNIYNLIGKYSKDPAFENFILKLKHHLLSHLLHPNEWVKDEAFSQEDWNQIHIHGDWLYVHKTLCINYTSYNIHGAQDTINSRTYPNVMTLKQQSASEHLFDYARVIGIFHVWVEHETLAPQVQELDVLWVRNFAVDTTYHSGFKRKWLTRLNFIASPDVFGFLNPDEQCFSGDILDKAFQWPEEPDKDDYTCYYVNLFVDRDMFMQYLGGGVGHYKIDIAHVADTGPEDDADADSNPLDETKLNNLSGDEGTATDTSGSTTPSEGEDDDNNNASDSAVEVEENILGYDNL
ncbi:hypothetical protein BDN71DRAFT_1426649 [Pleurotus eryngii]|uniref:Uncharacterized protein n=1 Tax=Pleurotus eryngii TaxID=5323 RepID=A0A9P6A957_PLEER|nr:hypothetical protein BDN71DRAFT_1426649 [Pleurotus eryngii]